MFVSIFLVLFFVSDSALSCNIKENKIVKKQQKSTFIFNLVGSQFDGLLKIKHSTVSSTTILYIGTRGNLEVPNQSVLKNRLQTINNTETQIVFNLLNVSKHDAGDYCDPLNYGVRLTVTDAPSVIITKQSQYILYPDSKNQLKGELNLTCDAISTTKPDNHNLPLVYTWFKDGIFHTTAGNTSILYDNNIDISYKDVNISCIATDDPGCTEVFKELTDRSRLIDVENNSRCIDVLGKSKSFTVQPEFGPYIVTIQPSGNITIRVTGEISVICESYCRPRCNKSWLKHGDEVRDGDQLNMTNIQKSNAGRYTCLVKNKHGERNNYFYLQVSEKPENTEIWSENKRVGATFKLMSTNISFECKTDGSNVTYTWYVNGRIIKNSSESNILSPDYQLSGTLTCLVENYDGRHNVSAQILVDNDNNKKTKNTEIWSENKRVGATFKLISTNISFECKTDGSNVTYTWYVNGRIINNSAESNLLSPDYQHSGTLTCLVENYDGRDNVSVQIQVDNDDNNVEDNTTAIGTHVLMYVFIVLICGIVTIVIIILLCAILRRMNISEIICQWVNFHGSPSSSNNDREEHTNVEELVSFEEITQNTDSRRSLLR